MAKRIKLHPIRKTNLARLLVNRQSLHAMAGNVHCPYCDEIIPMSHGQASENLEHRLEQLERFNRLRP
jgi:hypothetical protein